MHIEVVSLRHELTDSELAALAKMQSNALGKKAAADAELAAIKKDFGGRIALAEAEVTNYSQSINTGWEMRNVNCILIDERPEGYRLVVRSDNGHIAKRRRLGPEERQMKIGDNPELRTFVASALLPVDDETWTETDVFQVPLYQDELDMLRLAKPVIQFAPPPGRHRQIEAPGADSTQSTDKPGRGRPKKKR